MNRIWSRPLALVRGLLRLLQFLQRHGQPLLSPVQLLLHQLDATVQSCDFTLRLRKSITKEPFIQLEIKMLYFLFNVSSQAL